MKDVEYVQLILQELPTSEIQDLEPIIRTVFGIRVPEVIRKFLRTGQQLIETSNLLPEGELDYCLTVSNDPEPIGMCLRTSVESSAFGLRVLTSTVQLPTVVSSPSLTQCTSVRSSHQEQGRLTFLYI